MELIGTLLPMLVMFGILYFMMIRPQQKAAQQKKNMLEELKPGDSVVTLGGLHGVVDEVSQSSQTVVLDCEGVYLTFSLQAIGQVTQGGNIEERQEEIERANELAKDENLSDLD
ncbi:preprotein translocase subunit YajC [Hutsoniella sourekii]|uniref:preprotein translocase subunit YajC n=1 Tax=Hutsoniella sourekii TaxID=87650 RepID=UPI000483E1F7|nr:preprotein translocase subunit YajC [Hutsoniella sourekii]